MQSEILDANYAELFQISIYEAGILTKSFVEVIRNKHPDVEINTLEREKEEIIFVLENGIKVKFSPPSTIPVSIIPCGYSAKEIVYNFQLCTHLSRNRNLFTEENIDLLRRLQCKNKTPKEVSDLRDRVAYAFLIPKSEQARMWASGIDILAILMRIKNIDDKEIKINSKVIFPNDVKDFRIVRVIEPSFFLRLKGLNRLVDPSIVTMF